MQRSIVTLLLAGGFTLYWLVALQLDSTADFGRQAAIGLTAWAFLGFALRLSPPSERIQVVAMVLVATGFECLCSLLLGVYRYRLENLPLYVPPGHGLFFLVALRLADLPHLQRRSALAVGGVFLVSVGLVARGLMAPTPDLFGLGTWVVFTAFLLRGGTPLFYVVSFAMTMTLEFYGTDLGLWAWAARSPFLGLPTGNPPAAIGAGYCVMDTLARALANWAPGALHSVAAHRSATVRTPPEVARTEASGTAGAAAEQVLPVLS